MSLEAICKGLIGKWNVIDIQVTTWIKPAILNHTVEFLCSERLSEWKKSARRSIKGQNTKNEDANRKFQLSIKKNIEKKI